MFCKNPRKPIAIFKGDALVAVSDVLASNVTTSLYDGKVFTAGAEGQAQGHGQEQG